MQSLKNKDISIKPMSHDDKLNVSQVKQQICTLGRVINSLEMDILSAPWQLSDLCGWVTDQWKDKEQLYPIPTPPPTTEL